LASCTIRILDGNAPDAGSSAQSQAIHQEQTKAPSDVEVMDAQWFQIFADKRLL